MTSASEMSEPNLDQERADWQELLLGAVVDPEPQNRLGMIGTWAEAEDGWHHRPEPGVEVRLAPSPALGRVAARLAAATRGGEHEAERAITRTVAEARLAGA